MIGLGIAFYGLNTILCKFGKIKNLIKHVEMAIGITLNVRYLY